MKAAHDIELELVSATYRIILIFEHQTYWKISLQLQWNEILKDLFFHQMSRRLYKKCMWHRYCFCRSCLHHWTRWKYCRFATKLSLSFVAQTKHLRSKLIHLI